MAAPVFSWLASKLFEKPETVKPANLTAPTDPNAPKKTEIDQAQDENAQNQMPGWVQSTAQVIDYLNKQNAAREADLQRQRQASATQATSAMSYLPGLSGMTASGLGRARGLNTMAGR